MIRTHDAELIRSILTHPDIYPFITDDGCPSASEFTPIIHESVIYLYEPDTAIFAFIPDNHSTCSVHTNVLPEARGRRAVTAAREAAEWIWSNTQYRRINTVIREDRKNVIRFAEICGMKKYGHCPDSFVKDGIVYGQVLLGMSKPCQQQQYQQS